MAAALADRGVPNYDIHGHQHLRHPFKDKSYLLSEEVRHPKWLEGAPPVKSRSELLQARKQGRVPDPSYDFDRDGVVGQLDYFVGKCFDRDADGHLSKAERAQADKALSNGFMDKFVRGLDATGPVYRGCSVQQRRGVIMMADNPGDASALTYKPHFNAHVVPKHPTQTDLHLSRKIEAKSAGFAMGEVAAARVAPVVEPSPPNAETHPRTCPIGHIRERAEADHEAARYRAGLMPMGQPVNPERERKTVGLARVEQPLFATRGQLLETRKEAFRHECEDLRAKGDEVFVPLSVRRTQKEAREFEFRKQSEEPMTLTKLQDVRRQEKIEYDMGHFAFPQVFPREYPKFSDRPDVPFWVNESDAAGSGAPPPIFSRAVSEPTLKVTDVPFGEELRPTRATMPAAAYSLAAGLQSGPNVHLGSHTVKRWTTDMLERGQGRNKPRLFDDIQPARVGPRDMESLDLTSSMEPIRNAALRSRAEERRKNSENPRRSMLSSDSPTVFPRPRSTSVPSATVSAGLAMSVESSGGGNDATAMPRTSERVLLLSPAKVLHRSEPTLRVVPGAITLERVEKPRDPRCFGTLSQSTLAQTGVRSSGFQRFEYTQQTTQPAQQRARSNRSSGHATRRGNGDAKDEAAAAA